LRQFSQHEELLFKYASNTAYNGKKMGYVRAAGQVSTLPLKGCHKKTRNCREYIQDVRPWLRAVSADRQAALTAEQITTTVICDGHLGAAHDVPQE